eukprot:TRINITY_DN64877_c0_g1_i1.p1 TRINITY_DN64877_c0_g1~~TRINITY_DN64877_c0_g1_i1.p1  ORF type:complete len:332 (+),score=42.87 TRINITY_DN64877_c0_g1_i1:119-1114(+)
MSAGEEETEEDVATVCPELDLAAFSRLRAKRISDGCCAICHVDFEGSVATLLPCASFSSCPSFYHTECLLQWLERQLTCPLCRRSFEDELGCYAPEPALDLGTTLTVLSRFRLPSSPTAAASDLESSWHSGDVRMSWRLGGSERDQAPTGAVQDSPNRRSASTRAENAVSAARRPPSSATVVDLAPVQSGGSTPGQVAATVQTGPPRYGGMAQTTGSIRRRIARPGSHLRSPSDVVHTAWGSSSAAADGRHSDRWARSVIAAPGAAKASPARRNATGVGSISGGAWNADSPMSRSAGGPGSFFTPLERLDPDTRRTLQRRVEAFRRTNPRR